MELAQEFTSVAPDMVQRTEDEKEKGELRYENLPKVLRYIGAIALIAASVSFIMQRWTGMDSLWRYYSFLGFTFALSAIGVYCGIRMKEDKGARTFLGIAAAFLPAHFIQIGALIYSLTIDGVAEVPDFFLLVAPSAPSVATMFAVAMLVLVPTVYAGFSSLARAEARTLTLLYFAANALLLIPTRDPNTAAAIAGISLLSIIAIDTRLFRPKSTMSTWEGIAARSMLFSAPILVLGRNLALYPPTEILASMVFFGIGAMLFGILPRLVNHQNIKEFCQAASTLPLLAGWSLFIYGICFSPDSNFIYGALRSYQSELLTPFIFLPYAVMLVGLSHVCVSQGRGYRTMAATVATLATVLQMLYAQSVVSPFLCILTGTALLIAGFLYEERRVFQLGAVGFVFGLIDHLRYVVDLYYFSPWITLAIFGTSVVLAASYLEKNSSLALAKVEQIRKRLSNFS